MNIRHYLPKVIAIAVLAAATSCYGTVLGVTQHNQEMDQWCWDASSQMILEFFGTSVSQTEIANWAVQGRNVPNYLFNSPDSSRLGCDQVLSHFGNVSSSGQNSALSLSDLTAQIDAQQPPMIGISWDGGGGHAVVIHGTEGNTVYVRDPWPDNGPQVQSYEWVCRPYGNGTWSQTLKVSGTHETPEYEEYLALMEYYCDRYAATGSIEDLYNAYYYYALAGAVYYLSIGETSLAYSWYYCYMSNANYVVAYYCYSAWQYTGSHYYAAYFYYYYGYTLFYAYMYQGNTSAANYYYNLCMYYANWYLTH